ncbi:PREDICTED: uncharacterized protein LOC104706448 [Camelina sativa]|uniref:Uncharacterized protein LOC104706448 n=1 Tax=Camelina sativa TaxID=90675 RepID=A0ABM0T4Y7_CAMSA|nr:PREDICTED: uncharacterized protein LOC104706448 [Camelina sativa]
MSTNPNPTTTAGSPATTTTTVEIWDSLATYRPIKRCHCGLCTCDLATTQETDREEDKVHQFLCDDQFRAVRSSLVARVLVQPLEEVYNIVKQEEDLCVSGEERAEVVSFAVNTKPRFKLEDKEGMLCKLCNHHGHTVDRCYAVIGYPEWWGDRLKSRSFQGRGRGGSSNGGGRGMGHQVAYANHVNVPNLEPAGKEQANQVITDKDRDGVSGLTDQQWGAIKNILNAKKETASEKSSGRYDILSNIREMSPVLIIMADGRERVSLKEGSVQLGSGLVLQSVYYVDELHAYLISMGQIMDENRCVVQMSDTFLVVQDRSSRMVIGAGKRVGSAFHFRRMELAAAVTTQDTENLELWHKRMGHPSAKVLGVLPCISNSVSVINLNKDCDVCFCAKKTRESFPLSMNKTSTIFELIHIVLWGPYRVPSHSGARYFLTIVDDYSKGVWLYLLPNKAETREHLKKLFALTERQFNKQVKTVKSDNGTEFISLTSFFQQNGIVHETSCVGTPQQNGRVERKHRHILNVASALRFQANLTIQFWGERVFTAGYLINRTPSSILGNVTPFERLFNRAPSFDHLRVFGCLYYAHVQNRGGDKFVSRSRRCIFVGYPQGNKGWRVYDLENMEFFVSRDVVFSESKFPYSLETTLPLLDDDEEGHVLWAPISEGIISEDHVLLNPQVIPIPQPTMETNVEPNPTAQTIGTDPRPNPLLQQVDQARPTTSSTLPTTTHSTTELAEPRLGKGQRQKMTSVKLKDYVVDPAGTLLWGVGGERNF